jgi:hypothetical protein
VLRKTQPSLPGIRAFMENYARRGVFRGFSSQPAPKGVAAFRMIWHRDRSFDLIVDTRKKAILIPEVLPCVPAAIYRDFKAFVESRHAASLPDHRRIDKSKACVRSTNRRGTVSLRMAVKAGDYEYGLQRLIHLVHETYLIFLANGMYRDYMSERLGVNFDIG